MIDYLPKNGKIPKNNYLSLRFFQIQITKNLENVQLRIRDLIDRERKRKGKKYDILSEQEYLQLYFDAHKFDEDFKQLTHGPMSNSHKNFEIINKHFLEEYPLFYEPKWKIWLNQRLSLGTLALLNQLSYGYFYFLDEEEEMVPVLKSYTDDLYLLRGEVPIEIGTVKMIDTNKKKNQFCYFDYIVFGGKHDNIQIRKFDPRKCFDKSELRINHNEMKNKSSKAVVMCLEKIKDRTEMSLDPYECQTYCNFVVNESIIEDFQFKLHKFFWSKLKDFEPDLEERELYEVYKNNEQKLKDQQIIMKRNLLNFQKSAELVPFLEQIPNFTYHLSPQEKQVIELKGNVIVIGRSGTGKTTCALLRLFCLETLAKTKGSNLNQMTSYQFNKTSSMKNIFITASAYLIQELKKNYIDHVNNLKFHIEKEEVKNNVMIEQETKEKNENIDELKLLRQKIQKIHNKNMIPSLNFLKAQDFPGFFTLKNLLIMIDGVYNDTFFLRNEKKQLFRAEQFVGMRNYQQQKFFIKSESGDYAQSSEIEYDFFKEYFWKNEIAKRRDIKFNINPILVWSQIFTTIQGSTEAHKCPKCHINQQMYLKLSKNKFLSEAEKRQIFFIFRLYKKWKSQLNYFDLGDLVNHLLRKLLRNSYLGPVINCLFIDEVQDLTPASIYLITKIASNNVFYAGDTAQSISKGVNFKFADIKLLFKSQLATELIDKKEPQIRQLVVNFRSHDRILRFANFFIRLLQVLFPGTIDNLRKQTSSVQGPKPILIKSKEQIIKILSQNSEQSESFSFNSKQCIIVRDHAKKRQVQKIFPNALVLTIAECKGLQFNDVIVWEILQDHAMWKLLQVFYIQDNQANKSSKALIDAQNKIDNIESVLLPSLKLKQYNMNKYQQLCSELKIMYTAVTRARQVLILYNSLPSKMLSILRNLGLIADFSQECVNEVKGYKFTKKAKFNGRDEQMKAEMIEWKKKGVDFFIKENYQDALICFRVIGDERSCRQIEAKIKLKQGQKLRTNVEIDLKMGRISQQQAKYQNKMMKTFYMESAQIYEELQQYEEAAGIYYLVQEYKLALKHFEGLNQLQMAGNCYLALQNYLKAAQMFENSQKYARVVSCLEKGNRFILSLIKLVQYNQYFKDFEQKKQSFRNKIIKTLELSIKKTINQIEKKMQKEQQNKKEKQRIMQEPKQSLQGRKIIKSYNRIEELPIQQIKIALCFDKKTLGQNNSIQSYLENPMNISEIINDLQSRNYYELCLIFGSMFNQYQNFQDYFPVVTFDRFNNEKYEHIKKKMELNKDNFIGKQISKIDFEKLRDVRNKGNPQILKNLQRNLIFCGFYKNCEIFRQKKSLFYQRFMMQDKFIREMQTILKIPAQRQAKQNECNEIEYMRNVNWLARKLTWREITYSLQILYHTYDTKQKKQLFHDFQNENNQFPVLTKQEHGNAWRKITIIQKQLRGKLNRIDYRVRFLDSEQRDCHHQIHNISQKIQYNTFRLNDFKAVIPEIQQQVFYLEKEIVSIDRQIKKCEELQVKIDDQIEKLKENEQKQAKQKKKNKNKKNKNKNSKNQTTVKQETNCKTQKKNDQSGDERVEQQRQEEDRKQKERHEQQYMQMQKQVKKEVESKPQAQLTKNQKKNKKKNEKRKQKKKNEKNKVKENEDKNDHDNDNEKVVDNQKSEDEFKDLVKDLQAIDKKYDGESDKKRLEREKKQERQKIKEYLKEKNEIQTDLQTQNRTLQKTNLQVGNLTAQIRKQEQKMNTIKEKMQRSQQEIKCLSVFRDKILDRDISYDKGGQYFNRFMAKEVQKKLAYQFIGNVKLQPISKFLHCFYTNKLLSNEDLERLFKFSLNQKNQVTICEIVTLALSILSKQEDPFNNDFSEHSTTNVFGKQIYQEAYQDYDQKISFQQYADKIRQFFAKLIYILQNHEKNQTFNEILLGFFCCRTFNSDARLVDFKDFAIINSKFAAQLNLIPSHMSKQFCYFDANEKFYISQIENINYVLALFIKKAFQSIFPTSEQLSVGICPTSGGIWLKKQNKIIHEWQQQGERALKNRKQELENRNIEHLQEQKTKIKQQFEIKLKEYRKQKIREQYEKYKDLLTKQFSIESLHELKETRKILKEQYITCLNNCEAMTQRKTRRNQRQQKFRVSEENKILENNHKMWTQQIKKQINIHKAKEPEIRKKIMELGNQICQMSVQVSKLIKKIYSNDSKQINYNDMVKEQQTQRQEIDEMKCKIFSYLKTYKKKQQHIKKLNLIKDQAIESYIKIITERLKLENQIALKQFQVTENFSDEDLKKKCSLYNETIQFQVLKSTISYVQETLQQLEEKKKMQELQRIRQERIRKMKQQEERRRREIEELRKRREEEERKIRLALQAERKKREEEEKKNKLKQEQQECSICFINLRDLILECKHEFHLQCIVQHMKKGGNRNCPLCRSDLTKQTTFTGKCKQCNLYNVKFNLNRFIQNHEKDMFCDKCKISSRINRAQGGLYSYFERNVYGL